MRGLKNIYFTFDFFFKKKLEQFKVFIVVTSRLRISFLGSIMVT